MKQLEMRVTLERLNQHVHFAASNEQGNRIEIDGPARVGGEEGGFRPMQLILAGLASCASMDIVHILHKATRRAPRSAHYCHRHPRGRSHSSSFSFNTSTFRAVWSYSREQGHAGGRIGSNQVLFGGRNAAP